MQNAQKAAYAAKGIGALDRYEIAFSAPTFNEFVVRGPHPATDILERVRTGNDTIAGLALSKYYGDRPNDLLVCVTETNTKAQIDALCDALRQVD